MSQGEAHLNGRVTLYHGDSRDVLKQLPDNSIDSVVTDPPYALVSIVKRFGGANAAPAKGNDAYQRASAGFMGKQWDTGETAFAVEFWAEVMRVLKPGGHVIAASGTRTYHRLAVAIEDAGFEIRDMVQWLYGSGFPKSHDVSKGIDKRGGNAHLTAEVGAAIKAAREARGITKREADARYCGGVTLWSWYEGRPAGQQMPTAEVMAKIAADWPELADYAAMIAEAERTVIGEVAGTRLAVAPGQGNDRSATALEVTAASTNAAKQWQGWGTALKPACEPWVLARKPLAGTVAANVLAHGCGALNIDGCRVEASESDVAAAAVPGRDNLRYCQQDGKGRGDATHDMSKGRWPANVIHDGSDEVLAGFPETGAAKSGGIAGWQDSYVGGTYTPIARTGYDDAGGSAARFFYSAKADAMDRVGSKHPTVKPVDLMQYLCRLITPPGGTVLDPFAGSGSTGEAAWREGFRCVLIEREEEYAADIRRRLELADLSPETRAAILATRKADEPLGGLFAALGDE